MPGTDFHDLPRLSALLREPHKRRLDWLNIHNKIPMPIVNQQLSRCTNCGISFCQGDDGELSRKAPRGCPAGKNIPFFLECARQGNWQLAFEILEQRASLSGVTGRICPEFCAASCVHNQPDHTGGVNIQLGEWTIFNEARKRGLIKPKPPKYRNGKRIAIIGSGPAGLTAAWSLNQTGYYCTVFEAADRFGGMMRYGIPSPHLEREILDFYIDLYLKEGIEMISFANINNQADYDYLLREYDAIIVAIGARKPRPLDMADENLPGIVYALDFLTQQDKTLLGDTIENQITATGLDVLIVGGGFTAADTLATVGRQGARSIHIVQRHPPWPEIRAADNPWPQFPLIADRQRTYAHEEFEDILHIHWDSLLTMIKGIKSVEAVELAEIVSGDFKSGYATRNPGTVSVQMIIVAGGFTIDEAAVPDQLLQRPDIFETGDFALGSSFVINAIESAVRTSAKVDAYLQMKQPGAHTLAHRAA